MKRFILLYCGPPAPRDPSHAGWFEWFGKLGDAVVDVGSPMKDGLVVRADGSTSEQAGPVNGYSLVQAEDRSQVIEWLRDHPLLAFSPEFTIEVFEVPKR